jgi:hypothetical protein
MALYSNQEIDTLAFPGALLNVLALLAIVTNVLFNLYLLIN